MARDEIEKFRIAARRALSGRLVRRGEHLVGPSRVWVAGRTHRPARLCWVLAGKRVPEGKVLVRTCTVDGCAEPAHQDALTRQAAGVTTGYLGAYYGWLGASFSG